MIQLVPPLARRAPRAPSRRQGLTLLLGLGWLLAVHGPAGAQAGPAAAGDAARPQVIALLSAVGDQIQIVRQKRGNQLNLDPFNRQTLPMPDQSLNMAVLRGLQQALGEQEPQARLVPLRWTAPAALRRELEQARGPERDDLLLQALQKHLRSLPERSQWDRIEAVLPKFYRTEIRGMGSKLSGIGIFVQPWTRSHFDIDASGELSFADTEAEGGERTRDPNSGERSQASTYVAPYVYFERISLDAATLRPLLRQPQYDNVKYHDPNSDEADVFKHLSPAEMAARLVDLAERSAYQSIRGKDSSVRVSAPVPQAAASAAAR